MISKIKPDDTGEEEYTIRTKDIVDICGYTKDSGFYYQTIKKDIQKIAAVSCWIDTDPGKTGELFRWIDTAKVDYKKAEFRIKFHSTVIPYLFELRKNRTQYVLYNILCMPRKYSIRLYEYLLAMKYHGSVFEVSIDELKRRIDAEKYEKISHFKERVLEPAIVDINDYTELNIEYAYRKTGKAITHVVFKYHEEDNISYAFKYHARQAKIDPERRKSARERKKAIEERRKQRQQEAEAIPAEGTVTAQMTLEELIAALEGGQHEDN
jgi:plasmid replication initiation protein